MNTANQCGIVIAWALLACGPRTQASRGGPLDGIARQRANPGLLAPHTCTVVDFDKCRSFSHIGHLAEQSIYAVSGNCVVVSYDAGTSWQTRSCAEQIGPNRQLQRVQFVSVDEAWLMTDVELCHSIDGGRSWTLVQTGPRAIVRSFRFSSERLGFWVGEELGENGGPATGVVYRTTDGGRLWSRLSYNAQYSYDWRFRDVWSSNQTDVWLVGETLVHSIDGGTSWRDINADRTWRDVAIRFSTASIGWVARTPPEHYLRTLDGGKTWEARVLPWPGADSSNLAFVDDKLGWAAAGQTIRQTADGGATWTTEAACRSPRRDTEGSLPYQYAEYLGDAVAITGSCGRALLSRPPHQRR